MKKTKILIVFDMPFTPPENQKDYLPLLKEKGWEDERDLFRTLNANPGFEVRMCGVFNNINNMIDAITDFKPALIFPICESFANTRGGGANLVGIIELMGIRYTGASASTLAICRNKSLAKKVLHYHNIATPQFLEFSYSIKHEDTVGLLFPAIVKPRDLEASEELTKKSVVLSKDACVRQVNHLISKGHNVIVEQFIEGREIYLGVIGDQNPVILPPWELSFGKAQLPHKEFATYKVKWDNKYRKQQNIKTHKARNLNAKTTHKLSTIAKETVQAFGLKGYSRLDLRLTESGQPYLLEVNPNPAINRRDEFAKSAKSAGISYRHLLNKIIELAI